MTAGRGLLIVAGGAGLAFGAKVWVENHLHSRAGSTSSESIPTCNCVTSQSKRYGVFRKGQGCVLTTPCKVPKDPHPHLLKEDQEMRR